MIALACGIFATVCFVVFMATDTPRCWRCQTGWGVTRRRQNTAYSKDELNFAVLCPACHVENAEYWAERWIEYDRMTR